MGRATVRRAVTGGEDDSVHRGASALEHAARAPAPRVMQTSPRDGVGIDVSHHEIFLKRASPGHDGSALVHHEAVAVKDQFVLAADLVDVGHRHEVVQDRKSTRLNSSHSSISYAVFCL